MSNEIIKNFSDRNYVLNFIKSSRYDENVDYHIYLKYIKDNDLKNQFSNICIANGLLNLFYKRFNQKIYKGSLYDFIRSKEFKIIINAYKKINDNERDILSKKFGIEDLKNSNIVNIDNNKSLYTFGMRDFESNYRNEKLKALLSPIILNIKKDYNYYFTLDEKLKRNPYIIQSLLDNAKYQVSNYGEVLPYVTNIKQKKQLDNIIKINSYCALYLYIKTGSTTIPNKDFGNECIKDIINGKLIDIKKNHPIYVMSKYALKHLDIKYKKAINDFIGYKGKCYKLDIILKKFSNINSDEMLKQLRKLSSEAIIKNRNKKILIGGLVLITIAATGVAAGLSINHIKEIDSLKGDIENGGFYLDEYGSIDESIDIDNVYEEVLGDETFTLITINDLKDKDKIDNIINSGKKVGLIIRPNTTDFDEFNRNMTNLVIYYNYYENIKFPVLYDISVLKNNMSLNCEFASQFLAVMDKLGIKAGLYGDASIYNEFSNEYNNYKDRYKSITDFDNLASISTTYNLESDLNELSRNYNVSMVRLSNGYILVNKDYVDSYDGELFNSYILGENETIEDVAYKLNLSINYLCDINHFNSPSDVGTSRIINIPKSYRKIEKIGPGCSLLANLDNGDNVIKGIDVSLWNDCIDWKKLKDQGLGFAILRVADCLTENYDDPYVIDEQLSNNIKGCIENNIPYSFYYYTRATNPEDAALEARFVSRILHENGIESGNVFIDMETEPSEHGTNETLDEKIQISYEDEYKDECMSIIDSAKEVFEENGFGLMFYCGSLTCRRLNEWYKGGNYWVTSHETYDKGAPDDYSKITNNDGLSFSNFSFDNEVIYYPIKDSINVVQYCQWGKFDDVYDYQGLPQFFDLDYASQNFVNDYFYHGKNVKLQLEDGAKVL